MIRISDAPSCVGLPKQRRAKKVFKDPWCELANSFSRLVTSIIGEVKHACIGKKRDITHMLLVMNICSN